MLAISRTVARLHETAHAQDYVCEGVGALRHIDFSAVVLVVVLVLFGGGVWQMAHAFPDAGRGLVIFAREQKDRFVDAGLINESYHVRSSTPLAQRLRAETTIVGTRLGEHTAYMGAGVIVRTTASTVEILTAKHIVAHHGRKFVIFPDHVVQRARRVIVSPDRDLALVFVDRVSLTQYSHVRLAPSSFGTGQRFVVMGHPGARSWTASPGIAERHIRYTLLFCPSCDRGDSGAGAFDVYGALRGIVVSKATMRAPSARTGRYMTLTAFEIEEPEAIRSFLRSAR